VAATLLRLDTTEVVRLGLISNRGIVLVAAAFGALWQVLPDEASPDDSVRWVYEFVTRESAHLLPGWLLGPAGLASASFVLLIVALVIVRALSVALAVLQFHGFTLDEVGRQLRIERGLLTRVRLHLPRRRIQAWRVQETLLHRWFGRQSLRVDNASGEGEDGRGARDLVPLATPAVLEALITHLLPGHAWPPTGWRPLHPRAWRRLVVVPSVIIATASAVLAWRYGAAGLVMLGGLPIVVLRARLWADHTGYAEVDRGLIAVREGWLNKSWRFVEVRKLQSLRVTESPFDRRLGMATLWLDTAGASSRIGVMRIPFLPTDEARALHNRLATDLDGERAGAPS
jgi:putative membrane protein